MGTMDSVTRETAVMQDMSCCSLGVLDSVTRCYSVYSKMSSFSLLVVVSLVELNGCSCSLQPKWKVLVSNERVTIYVSIQYSSSLLVS